MSSPTFDLRLALLVSTGWQRANTAKDKFGPHPSCEFAACRVAEECGELVQAATAMSKGRYKDRSERVWNEAVDVIAMVIRLVEEFPDGSSLEPEECHE